MNRALLKWEGENITLCGPHHCFMGKPFRMSRGLRGAILKLTLGRGGELPAPLCTQCTCTSTPTNATLKLTLARDIGVVVEEEGMVNCSPLDSCSGQWRSWQRWGMATSSTWLLVRRTRHHCILYLPFPLTPLNAPIARKSESGDIIV